MLKQAIVFSFGLVILLVAFILIESAASPFFQACISGHEQGQHDSAAKNDPSGFGSVINDYVRCSGRFIDRHQASINALATLVIAAFTGTLWIATSRQADLTREAFIAGRRAFVFVSGFRQFWERDNNTGLWNWRFKPILKNTGLSATRNFTMYVQCEIRNTVLPTGYGFDYPSSDTGRGVIPPNVELNGGIAPRMPGAGVTPQDIVDAQNGRKFIYLWGWVRYGDIFEFKKTKVTRYCFLITPVGDPFTFVPNTVGSPPTPGTLSFPYIHHTEGNHIDE